MRRFHASIASCLLVTMLVATPNGSILAQREPGFGLCHIDPATGTAQYLEVPEPDIREHMEHGDWTAPNGPDDCTVASEPSLPDDEVRPTEVPPDVEDVPAPVAQDDEFEAEVGVPLEVPAPGVLANDRGATSAVLVRDPSWGTLDFGRDGSFTYVADRENPGSDTFAYQAMNEEGDIGEVYVILPPGVNAAPVAVDDVIVLEGAAPFVIAAPGVLANDYDPDGDPVTLVGIATGVKGGAGITSTPDGGFTFIPPSGISSQPFTIWSVISDGLEQAEGNLTIEVYLDPDSPVTAHDSYNAPTSGTQLVVAAANGLLANDSSPVGSGLVASLYQGYPGTNVTVDADGAFTVSIPGGAKPGTFMSFWYQITDSQGRAVLESVSIHFQ